MFGKVIGCSLIACLFLAGPALAQTALVWKFTKGQVYEVERKTAQKQAVEIKGKEFKQERQSTWHVRLEVMEAQAEGFRIAAVLTAVEHRLAGAGATEMIDPRLAEKMQGSTFKLLVSPHGRVLELKGHEEFLNRLAQNDAARVKALRVTFPEDMVREVFADLFGPLPEKKVAVGDAWERSYVEPIPHFGALRSTVHYVYEGRAKEEDRIDYTIRTMYVLPKSEMMVLFRVVKGSIQSEKARGTILLDAAAGHLVEHERTMLLRGTLTIESMDRQQPLEFTSANEVKIRIKAGKK